MNLLFDRLNGTVRLAGQFSVDQDLQEVANAQLDYYGLPKNELRELCRNATSGLIHRQPDNSGGFLRRAFGLLASMVGRNVVDELTLKHLALGIEAFSAAPADLPNPDKAKLYPEQVRAAIALTQRALIQMDTGEGKTYAILPAAFALACKHYRVYIVCANEYLAWRDAKRTKSYWDFVGLSVGLGIRNMAGGEWGNRIVYTTLEQMIFKSLQNEISSNRPEFPITFGSIVLDEADAILLDQAKGVFTVVTPLNANSFDWQSSIDISNTLIEGGDIEVDRLKLSASLTERGEVRVRNSLKLGERRSSAFLLMRYSIEIAFIAIHVVVENKDYVVEGDKIFPVDQVTGEVRRGQTPYWVMPLEYMRGYSVRTRDVTLHFVATETFISDFEHVSGLSGTIEEDSLEYLFGYRLLTITIPPGKKRKSGLLDDRICLTTRVANMMAYQDAVAESNSGRPVIIGTQSISEAEDIFGLFQTNAPDMGAKLLTGRNDHVLYEIFNQAGQAGSIVITTQLAGRGVDIRLSDEAKNNGGMHLISVGHAMTARHDRQFLGRAGRQGDPWSARFISALDQPFMKRVGGGLGDIMRLLKMPDEEIIEHPLVTKSIRWGQQNVREIDFWMRRQQSYLNLAFLEIRPAIRVWFEQIRYIECSANDSDGLGGGHRTSPIDWLIERFIEGTSLGRLRSLNEVKSEMASDIVAVLNELEAPSDIRLLTESDVEGRTGAATLHIIRRWLQNSVAYKIDRAQQLNRECEQLCDRYAELGTQLSAGMASIFQDAVNCLPDDDIHSINDEIEWVNELANAEGVSFNIDSARRIRSDVKCISDIMSVSCNYSEDGVTERDRLIFAMGQIEVMLAEFEAVCLRLRKIYVFGIRTPLQIASWTVKLSWAGFIEESDRLRHRTFGSNCSPAESYRLIYDNTLAYWDRVAAELPKEMLRNLLLADAPESLDDIFRLADNRDDGVMENGSAQGEGGSIFEWAGSPCHGYVRDNVPDQADLLIGGFVSQVDVGLSKTLTPEAARRLLKEFLTESPLTTLQTPLRIQTSLERWFVREGNVGLTTQRRRVNRKWIREFLIYLCRRSVIGPLPDFRHQAATLINRFAKAMSEAKTAISVIGCCVFIIAFLLLSFVTFPGMSPLDGEYVSLFEALIFGGLLNKGAITALGFGSLILSSSVSGTLFPRRVTSVKGVGLDAHLALLFQVLFVFLLVQRSGGAEGFVSTLLLGILVLGALLFSRIAQSVTWGIENATGVSLVGIWLCYTSLIVAMPIVLTGEAMVISIGIAAALFLIVVWWRGVGCIDVVLGSTRIIDVHMNREEINSCVVIGSNGGIAAHVFGLLLAISGYEFFNVLLQGGVFGYRVGVISQYLAIGMYLFAIVAFTAVVIGNRLSLHGWVGRLNSNRQYVVGADSAPELDAFLTRSRNKLILMETVFVSLIVIIPCWIFKDQTYGITGFPSALLLVFFVALGAHYGRDVFIQLYKLIFCRSVVGHEILNMSRIKSDELGMDWWDKVNDLLRNRMSLILAILIIVVQALTLIVRGWDLIRAVGS